MPTYDYLCSACGHRFEEFQSMSAAPLRKCPACKKQKLDRLIGAGAGVIFKGSGFYQTDYKSSGPAPSEGGGGCAPSCGTSDAPAGCKMPKK
jgi:putative FmdB family regulatory protein